MSTRADEYWQEQFRAWRTESKLRRISALCDAWEATPYPTGHTDRYDEGYADALDFCAQALRKALES